MKFKVGSATISPEDEEKLKQLAQTATDLKGYIIEVMGYANATGSAAMNTKLSEERAKTVITYLVHSGRVPVAADRGTGHDGRTRRGGGEPDSSRQPKSVGLRSKP